MLEHTKPRLHNSRGFLWAFLRFSASETRMLHQEQGSRSDKSHNNYVNNGGTAMESIIEFVVRWGHVLFGITWIGFLYYFNFVQGGYFKKASPEGLADAKQHLAPAALWWFRWGAVFTFLTGLYLWHTLKGGFNNYIAVGAVMGTLMFLNVWLIIWPNQKIALGMKEGDAAAAGGKALLASRTNTLFSAPMVLGMLASKHIPYELVQGSSTGLYVMLGIVLLLELNAIFGKQGPIASVKGVIHCSVLLSVVMTLVLHYL